MLELMRWFSALLAVHILGLGSWAATPEDPTGLPVLTIEAPRATGIPGIRSGNSEMSSSWRIPAASGDQLILPWDERGVAPKKAGPVLIYRPEGPPGLTAAVERLSLSLQRAVLLPRQFPLSQFRTQGQLAMPFATSIVIAEAADADPLFPKDDFGGIAAESFRIKQLPGNVVVVAGGDAVGTTCGTVTLAERVAAGGDLGSVGSVEGNPVFSVRGISVPETIFGSENREWLTAVDYWHRLFSDMVLARWNTVFVPGEFGLGAEGIAAASPSMIRQAAREYGLRVIVDWNSDLDERALPRALEAFEEEASRGWIRGVRLLLTAGEIRSGSSPLVKRLLEARPGAEIHVRFPDGVEPATAIAWLDGLGNTAISIWPSSNSDPDSWKDVVADRTDVVRLMHWCPVVPYQLTRWGDTDLAGEDLRLARTRGSTGVGLEGDEWLFGPDRIGTRSQVEKCQNWTYLHEKKWSLLWAWGKAAYDGEVSREDAEAIFVSRFGDAVGPAMMHSQLAASRILTSLVDFFPDLARPGLFLEGSWLGTVRPEPAKPDTPPARGRLLSARVFAEMEVDPRRHLGIPELVGMRMAGLEASQDRRIDPLELADELADLAHECRESARVAHQQEYSPVDIQESRSYDLEMQFMANLARYYAWQLWGAVEGCSLRALPEEGPPTMPHEAVEGILREWGYVTRLAEHLYLPLRTVEGTAFHWKTLADELRKESSWIESCAEEIVLRPISWSVLGPIPFNTRHLAAVEKICSGTGAPQLGMNSHMPPTGIAWEDLTTHVLGATAEQGLPAWAERFNRYAGFVNFHRAYESAVEGVGFAWRVIVTEEAVSGLLECSLGDPERVWLNGEKVHDAAQFPGTFPIEGIPVRLRAGENHLIFRSDLHRGRRGYWGAALQVRRSDDADQAPPGEVNGT